MKECDCWYVMDCSICWTWIWTQLIMTLRLVLWERIHLKAKVLSQQSEWLTCWQSYLNCFAIHHRFSLCLSLSHINVRSFTVYNKNRLTIFDNKLVCWCILVLRDIKFEHLKFKMMDGCHVENQNIVINPQQFYRLWWN